MRLYNKCTGEAFHVGRLYTGRQVSLDVPGVVAFFQADAGDFAEILAFIIIFLAGGFPEIPVVVIWGQMMESLCS